MPLNVSSRNPLLSRLRARLIPFAFAGLMLVPLGGCSSPQPVEPAEEDRRFAAFYSDYLLASGVSGRSQGAPAVAALDSAALGALLEKHGLDVGALQERTEAYRHDPELWQQVLMQVREEIKLKNRSGK